jgi:hypothetical protein
MRHMFIALFLLIAASSTKAQIFQVPWVLNECQMPYSPYGSSAKVILDTMLRGSAREISYDVVDGDTNVFAKVSPRARASFFTTAAKGLERIVITMQFQSEQEAFRQLDVSMLELRKWYVRQSFFKMYDEEHIQRCGSETWIVRGRAGKKQGLLNTFQLTFSRRS